MFDRIYIFTYLSTSYYNLATYFSLCYIEFRHVFLLKQNESAITFVTNVVKYRKSLKCFMSDRILYIFCNHQKYFFYFMKLHPNTRQNWIPNELAKNVLSTNTYRRLSIV